MTTLVLFVLLQACFGLWIAWLGYDSGYDDGWMDGFTGESRRSLVRRMRELRERARRAS